jgi:peptidoglycan/xylan/chitin deacetylase (PgdA/CDA1 family)
MYFVKIPAIVKIFFPSYIWEVKERGNIIYLTFDDGPNPETTTQILKILNQYEAKATFFCTGQRVESNSELLSLILKNGHQTGHHGYQHLNGWKTKKEEYISNIEKCNPLFKSNIFRPPYGRITLGQKKALKPNFKIVMWTLMPGDFDAKISKEECLKRSIQNTKPGSIVVFHDTINSIEKLAFVLPIYIEHFQKKGYTFKALDPNKK